MSPEEISLKERSNEALLRLNRANIEAAQRNCDTLSMARVNACIEDIEAINEDIRTFSFEIPSHREALLATNNHNIMMARKVRPTLRNIPDEEENQDEFDF